MSTDFQAFAVARFANGVVLIREGARLGGPLIPREIDYLVGQPVVEAVDDVGRQPEGALAVRADAVHRGDGRVQAHTRVQEHAVLDDHVVAQNGHQIRLLQPELRIDDLDDVDVGERQGCRNVPQLAVHYVQRLAVIRQIQLVHTLDRDIPHDEVRHVDVTEVLLELDNVRIFNYEHVDARQGDECMTDDRRYPADVRQFDHLHLARRDVDIEVETAADVLDCYLVETGRLR